MFIFAYNEDIVGRTKFVVQSAGGIRIFYFIRNNFYIVMI